MRKFINPPRKAATIAIIIISIFSGMEMIMPAKAATELPYIPIIGVKKAAGPIYLEVKRNSIGENPTAGDGDKRVLFSDITFVNHGSKNIYINNPTFMSLSNEDLDGDQHGIQRQIKNFRLSVDGQEDCHLYIIGGYILQFYQTKIIVAPNASVNIKLTGDITDYATASALNFDLYCNRGSSFSIDYGNLISPAPFNFSGQIQDVSLPENGNSSSSVYSVKDSYYTNHYHNIIGTWAAPYIPEGTMIRAKNGIDVYIVKHESYHDISYKRLILSPSVFESYQHLKWTDILEVDSNVLDYFETSSYAQVAGDSHVWRLDPQDDTGMRHEIVNVKNLNGIYEINATDRDSYMAGDPITSD